MDQSYLEIGRGIARAVTFITTLTRRLDLSPRVVHGVFNPEVPWDGQDLAVASQRYGVNFLEAYKIGDGEAFGPDAVLEVALHPSNPLGINQSLVTLRPGGGVKDSRIYTDCMIVGASPTSLAWRWFQAKHAELFGVAPPVDPPPPPPPPPVDPPPPPPPPPPVDPPEDPPIEPPHVCPPCPPAPQRLTLATIRFLMRVRDDDRALWGPTYKRRIREAAAAVVANDESRGPR